MITEVSKRIQERILKAIDDTDEKCVFSIKCNLVDPNSDYKLEPRYVKAFSVEQDFYETYTDTVQIQIAITPEEQKEILAHMQDLECSLIFYRTDVKTGELQYDQDPIIKQFRVFMDNQVDLEKKFNANAFGDSETGQKMSAQQAGALTDFTMHLITKDLHDLRLATVNSLMVNQTVETAIQYACSTSGIKRIKMVTPDDTSSHPHIEVPQMKLFPDFFKHMQSTYGVYAKGLGYYITEEEDETTISIYPQFDWAKDTTPEKMVLHIINAANSQYLGASKYHSQEDDDLYVIAVGKVDVKPLNSLGAENVGTAYMTANSEQMLDKFATIGTDGKVKVNDSVVTSVTSQNQAGNMSSGTQNIMYGGESNNLYENTTKMAAMNGTILTCAWLSAIPWMIQPGQNVTYHFDAANGEYHTQDGRILKITYMSKSHPSAASGAPVLTFGAIIQAFLEPDKKSEDQIQQTSE